MYFFITKNLHHSPFIHSFTHSRKCIELPYVPDPMLGSRDIKSMRQALKVRAGKGDRNVRR